MRRIRRQRAGITMSKKASSGDFESRLKKLETIVSQLEQGEMSLEQSLAAFEEGVKLLQECQQSLSQAEQKVQLLMEQQGRIVAEPFTENRASDADDA